MPNTSSTGSSGCSQVDRFTKHFEKCRNREGHVKASVFLHWDSVERAQEQNQLTMLRRVKYELPSLDALMVGWVWVAETIRAPEQPDLMCHEVMQSDDILKQTLDCICTTHEHNY